MTQLIASYELAIGCESTATLSPFQPSISRASFIGNQMKNFFSGVLLRFNNARSAIRQIRRGEWKVETGRINDPIYAATRCGYRLWLANGAFFCDVTDFNGGKCKPAFGLLWRHYVWFAAARKLKKRAERERRTHKHTPIL